MSDLQKYIKKRKKKDPAFAENFDSGYEHFTIGVLLKQAREESGLTQEELASRRYAPEQGTGPDTVNTTIKLRLLALPTAQVSTAIRWH